MSLGLNAFGGNVVGKANAAADTVYYAVVPGKPNAYTRVSGFALTSGNTANAGYFMRPLGRANVATAFTADSGAAITLDADPSPTGNTIAAGDQVVLAGDDGTYVRAQVNTSGWNSSTKVLTFTANVAVDLSVGAKVWNFGVSGDTDPVLGTVHPFFASTVNTQRVYTFGPSGIRGHQKGDPLLFYCPNATNATVLDYAEYACTIE